MARETRHESAGSERDDDFNMLTINAKAFPGTTRW
jgi:hypothetical protein